MNPWYKRLAIAGSTAVAVILLSATAASAQPVKPNPNEGWISMTQRTCGSSASWQEQARRNGSTAYPWTTYLGHTYDIQCGSVKSAPQQPQRSVPQSAPTGYSDPLPSSCGSRSSFGAPRVGHRHQGIDLGAGTGTPIRAISSGTVFVAGWVSGNAGRGVEINNNGVVSKYFHMSRVAVSNGQRVKSGQVIGYVGATGDATGPHLHLEIWVNGSLQNPGNFLSSRGVNVYC